MSSLAPRPRVHADVTNALGARIVQGKIASGATLPNEAALVDEFGVSRSAIRESLRVLSAKGLIAARARIGTIVQDPANWNLLDTDVLLWATMDPPNTPPYLLAALIEARQVIEPAAAALAAARAKAIDLARIEAALDQMATQGLNRDAFIEADLAFHEAVVRASGNVIFTQFIAAMRQALLESFRRTGHDKKSRADGYLLHKPVYDAIRAQNPDDARRAAQALLTDTALKLEVLS